MCSLLVGLSAPALAQESFPTRPITIVVPFSAGGTAAVLARAIALRLPNKPAKTGTEETRPGRCGKSVIVENPPGAGGTIGAHAVAAAKPDGHPLVLGTVGVHAAYSIYSKL